MDLAALPLESRENATSLVAAGGLVYVAGGFFQPFADYRGPLSVAAAPDVNGNGAEDVVVGAGAGGGPRVAVFDGSTREKLADFFAFEPTFRGGVTVATDADAGQLLVGAGPGGGPVVVAYSLADFRETGRVVYGDSASRDGVDVAGTSGRTEPPTASYGTGPFDIYLDLAGETPAAADAIAGLVAARFEPLFDAVTVTTVRPSEWPSDYLTVAFDAPLAFYGADVAGVTASYYASRTPNSFVPGVVYVAPGGSVAETAVAAAHEVGHYLGLNHVADPHDVMNPVLVDDAATFDAGQYAEMRATLGD